MVRFKGNLPDVGQLGFVYLHSSMVRFKGVPEGTPIQAVVSFTFQYGSI